MKKHLYATARYLIFFLACFIIFYPTRAAIDVLYNALSEWFPGIFPEYNFITDRAAAQAHETWANFISAAISLPISVILTVVYDNARFEYIISATDGFYTLREGAKFYTDAFLTSDVLASVLAPAPVIAMLFLPDIEAKNAVLSALSSSISAISAPCRAFSSALGIAGAVILILSLSFISRIPAAYLGLKKWRAAWLSDIGGRI